MNTVKLYGSIGKEFGTTHRFQIESIPEAIRALSANFPEFSVRLRHGFYRVVIGKTAKNGTALDETTIQQQPLGDETLHIVPVTKGRSRGGLGKVLAGMLLVGLAAFSGGAAGAFMAKPLMGSTYGAVMGQVGVGLALTGVASLIAPETKSGDDTKSFTHTGPQMTTREGGIVPIVYGEVITGGMMVSAVMRVENNMAVK